MKQLIFNDGRNVEIQKVSVKEGILHVRLILTTSEQLKSLFADEFATSRMAETENGKEVATYENYTKFSYIKEEAGGIWEVEMLQPEADIQTRVTAVEEQTQQNALALEQAIVELTTMLAAFMAGSTEGV